MTWFFVQFSKEGVEHFAFLRIALRETLTHLGGEVDNPIKLTQNNLPGFGTGADEALVVNLQSRKYHLIEKRIKYNGSFLNYFSENLLAVAPKDFSQEIHQGTGKNGSENCRVL